jgi:soluble lytic murein transglycosylase
MRIPQYDNFRAMPDQFRPVEAQAQTPRVDPGAQMQALGQGLQQAGATMMDIDLKEFERVNQLRVDDALNRALEAEMRLAYDKDVGYTNQRGLAALEREGGRMLADEYGEEYGRAIEGIAAGLGNDAQRQAFASAAQKRLTMFRAGAMKHEAGEFQTYELSVREGTIARRMQEIGLNYANPEAVDEAITSIRAAAYDAAKLQSKSATWAEQRAQEMVSRAHRTAIAAALQNNDVAYADGYMRKYGKDMTADDLLQAQGVVTREMDLRVATERATDVMGRYAPRIVPGDMDRLTNIVMGIESNGRRFDDQGNLLEGPQTRYGTAKGEMQVLDGTNRDPGFGVKPAADDSPEERARVGRDYLAAMVRRYDGDVARAMAAYNWGPGNLDKAISEHGDNWLQNAPQETRNYVERGMREYGAGQGRGPRPTLAEIKADLRADPALASNPARLKQAEAVVESQFREMEAARKQEEEQVLDAVYHGLYENGGNLQALPADVRMRIAGDKLGSVMSFADQVAKGKGTHSPEAWAMVLSMPREALAGMAPIEFFRQFRPVLDDAHLEKGYALLKEAQGTAGANELQIITTDQRIKSAAITAGIIKSASELGKNKDQLEAFTRFQQEVERRVRQVEQVDLQGKRKANGQELQQVIDSVLLDKAWAVDAGWAFFDAEQPVALMDDDTRAKAYVRVGGEEIRLGSIPDSQRASIVSSLESDGQPVTEQRIAELWVKAGRPTGNERTSLVDRIPR